MKSKLLRSNRHQHLQLPDSYLSSSGQLTPIHAVYRQLVAHQLQRRVTEHLSVWCPKFVAIRPGQSLPSLQLPDCLRGEVIHWQWQPEQGEGSQGSIFTHTLLSSPMVLDFNDCVPTPQSGVWHWQLRQQQGQLRVAQLPERAYEPEQSMHYWGPAIQLYSVRSHQSWGMGDFSVLKRIIQQLSPFKPGFIGLNPLHALDPFEPEGASPYSPVDRRALNPLYIDPEQLSLWPALKQWWAWHPRKQMERERLQQLAMIDYRSVARLKYTLLLKAFRLFEALPVQDPLKQSCAQFCEQQDWLDGYSRFFALRSRFGNQWQLWSEQVVALSKAPLDQWPSWLLRRYQMAQFLQFLADEQLADASTYAVDHGIPLGLYLDLAVGAGQCGSEVWQNQELLSTGLEMGAPPDPLAPQGQCWGLPVMLPSAIEHSQGRYWQQLLRANMRHAGALRIDHAMALSRIWAVPQQHVSAQGAYVTFDLDSNCLLLNQISQEQQTLVVAEDLGTVPEEVAREFPKFAYRGMSMLIFEREGDRLPNPQSVKQQALAVLSSHDMPPLHSFWQGSDIDLRQRLGLISDEQAEQMRVGRQHERADILRTLGMNDQPWGPDLNLAFHRYLLDSRAELVSVQIEDMLLMDSPINVPGTNEQQYHNWRRAIPLYVEEWSSFAHFQSFMQQLVRCRPGR